MSKSEDFGKKEVNSISRNSLQKLARRDYLHNYLQFLYHWEIRSILPRDKCRKNLQFQVFYKSSSHNCRNHIVILLFGIKFE